MDTWRHMKRSKRHNSISSAKQTKPTHSHWEREILTMNKCSAEHFFSLQTKPDSWVEFFYFICAITKASDHLIVSWESAPKIKPHPLCYPFQRTKWKALKRVCIGREFSFFLPDIMMQFIWYQHSAHCTGMWSFLLYR